MTRPTGQPRGNPLLKIPGYAKQMGKRGAAARYSAEYKNRPTHEEYRALAEKFCEQQGLPKQAASPLFFWIQQMNDTNIDPALRERAAEMISQYVHEPAFTPEQTAPLIEQDATHEARKKRAYEMLTNLIQNQPQTSILADATRRSAPASDTAASDPATDDPMGRSTPTDDPSQDDPATSDLHSTTPIPPDEILDADFQPISTPASDTAASDPSAEDPHSTTTAPADPPAYDDPSLSPYDRMTALLGAAPAQTSHRAHPHPSAPNAKPGKKPSMHKLAKEPW